jgi:RNA recognition motif-containing protein
MQGSGIPSTVGEKVFDLYPERSVFVRDLPYCCTSEALKDFFQQELAEVAHPLQGHVFSNNQGKTMQYGSVLFENEQEAAIAITRMNGKRFIGRNIR